MKNLDTKEKNSAIVAAKKTGEKTQAEKTKKKCIHEGHRGRLCSTALQNTLYGMSEIQVVELFLTYIFPRGDVNPLAHSLLDKYETFHNIIDAEVEDLKLVPGIGDRAATLIHLFGEFVKYYISSRTSKKYKICSTGNLMDVVEDYLKFRNTEHILLLAISASNVLTHKRLISRNNAEKIGIDSKEVTNFINSTKLCAFAIAHCHPFGYCTPSKADWEAYECMKDICRACGVNFVDSFILGEDGIYSQHDDRIKRRYVSGMEQEEN